MIFEELIKQGDHAESECSHVGCTNETTNHTRHFVEAGGLLRVCPQHAGIYAQIDAAFQHGWTCAMTQVSTPIPCWLQLWNKVKSYFKKA